MKTLKFIALSLIILSVFSTCDKEEESGPERTTHVVTLENNTGITGCFAGGLDVTFLVRYRDIVVEVVVMRERSAIINVLVEDNESINIIVQNASDGSRLADKNVVVRTESRPDHLEGEHRRISYCQAFNLIVSNF